jgi:hemolysin activation/secretion protein
MKNSWTARLALCLGLYSIATVAQAAPPSPPPPQIDPGQINNANQKAREKLQDQNNLPQEAPVVAPPQKAPKIILPPGPTFLLTGVKIDESTLLKHGEIAAVTSKYVGTQVDMARIQKMVAEINSLYSSRGFATATAYLPPQEVTNGVVQVKLVEGRLEKITVTGAKALKQDFVRAHIDEKPGDVVNLPQVADQLSAFNKTGVARFQALLQPGTQFGMTDIEIAVTEPPRDTVQVFYDNEGVASVGANEGGILAQAYAPLGIDDKFTLYAVGSEGNLNGNVAYNVPFDTIGGRVGVSLTKGQIRVISGTYENLHVHGRSDSAALNLSQPLFANANWLFLYSMSLVDTTTTSSQFQSPTSHVLVTSNDTKVASEGLSVGYASQRFSITLSPTVSEATSASKVSHLTTQFITAGGSGNAYLQLARTLSLSVSSQWQVASKDTLPGDQLFQAGGPSTVRGYETNAAAGPTGFFTNTELRNAWTFHKVEGSAFLFYDHGEVYNHFPAAQIMNSMGAGLAVALTKRISADFTAGFPLKKVVGGEAGREVYVRLTTKLL